MMNDANNAALIELIGNELTTRLGQRVLEASTPEEAAKDFVSMDVERIEAKAFRLIDLDEQVISDAVYAECDYTAVRDLASDMMQHGPAPRPAAVPVAAGAYTEDDIPF